MKEAAGQVRRISSKTGSTIGTKSGTTLVSSHVYVRIRPMVFDGSGHDQDGPGVAKSLASYTDASITLHTQYMFSKGSAEYTFPTKVFHPSSTQTEVYHEVIPALVDQVETSDAMLLAYGQTATGKTVTIFGFENSLKRATQNLLDGTTDTPETDSVPTIDPDWGILPRLTYELFAKFQPQQRKTMITISAIEFYLAMIYDLLQDDTENDKNTVRIDGQNKPAGYKRIVLESPSDIFGLIEKIMARRTSRGTNMNFTDKDQGHAGSSRSHCALIFTILQVEEQDGDVANLGHQRFRQTCFHLVDLAGAERPSKVGSGDDDVQGSGAVASYKLMKGEAISAVEEGLLINYTLFEFCKEVKLATSLHKKNKPYRAPRQLGTDLTKYLGRCIDGRALLAMIVCISQAPQCGWETWFSMNYGTDLSELCTPVTEAKWFNLANALQRCEEAYKKAQKVLADHERIHAGSTQPNSRRWHGRKRTDLREFEERLQLLKALQLRTNHS